jgi:phosphoenolpyruvate carboxylase
MGQWMGGDRDGNPNVNADTLQYAMQRQCEVALRHYLTEIHWLGSELSTSAMLVGVPPALQALADSSPDTNAHRQDEPYRRSLTFMYARLAATLITLDRQRSRTARLAAAKPYPDADSLLADLRTLDEALTAQHAQALALPRLRPLMRAVQVFGFHLATVDLRQSSDQHELVVAELLKVAGIEAHYAKLDEAATASLAAASVERPAPLAHPAPCLQRPQRVGIADFRNCAADPPRLWTPRDSPRHHQPHRKRQRFAGGVGAAKRSRACCTAA